MTVCPALKLLISFFFSHSLFFSSSFFFSYPSFPRILPLPAFHYCDYVHLHRAPDHRQSIEIGQLVLPSNGKLMLGDKVSLKFNEGLKTSGSTTEWKCKDISETNWKCGANWATQGFDGEAAHRVPCASDTVIFPDDTMAYQINVPQNTFVNQIRIENPKDLDVQSAFIGSDGDYTISDQNEVNRFFGVYGSQFQGGVVSVGDECGDEDACEEFCHNHCSELDDDQESQRRVLVNAMEKQLQRVSEQADKVESDMAPDEALGKTRALSGGSQAAKNSITGFNELRSAFDTKFANLFANEDGSLMGVRDVDDSNNAKALTDMFALDLNEHMSKLAGSFDVQSASDICSVTNTGGVNCDNLGEWKTTYGRTRDATRQLWYKLNQYFDQAGDLPGVIAGSTGAYLNVARGSNKCDADTDCDFSAEVSANSKKRFEFAFSDADFGKTRYARGVFPKFDGDSVGFLSADECDVIEASMDMGYTKTLIDEYNGLDNDQKADIRRAFKEEVELTSVCRDITIDPNWLSATPAPKDNAKTHKFDMARFSVKVEFENMPREFDMDSIREAFAVAFWHQITAKVLPEYALKEFNKYTSTTSTTVTTTTITTSTTTIAFNPEEDFDEDTLAEIAETDLTTLLENEVAGRKLFADADLAFRDALNSDDSTSAEIAELKEAMVKASEAYNLLKEMVTKKTDDNLAAAEASAAAAQDKLDGALQSNIIPILAGGGGLIVLLIIIVVVVSTSGGGGGGGSGDGYYRPGDASVVAFENPMYDDPSSSPTQNPIMDEDEEDGGLYDEPAFNAEEPEDEAAGGGYLDVEPDEESEAEESEAEESEAEESAAEEAEESAAEEAEESEEEESEAAESSEEESSAESDE